MPMRARRLSGYRNACKNACRTACRTALYPACLLLCGLLGHLGDVQQAVARARDIVLRDALQHLVQSQFTQALVQAAGQLADAHQQFIMAGLVGRIGFHHHGTHGQAPAFSSFSKIFDSFSSSVAAVNGLTT